MGPRRDRRDRRAAGTPSAWNDPSRNLEERLVSTTRLMTAATMGVAGLLLTGCGSAAPGIAAKVGDETITVKEIDAATSHYCTSVGEQLESPVPMSFVRQYVVQLLTLRAQTDQIADDYGVKAGTSYGTDVAQRRSIA